MTEPDGYNKIRRIRISDEVLARLKKGKPKSVFWNEYIEHLVTVSEMVASHAVKNGLVDKNIDE